MGKIVGLTYDLKTDWASGGNDPQDANAEFDKPQTIERIVLALSRGGHTVRKIGNVLNLLSRIDSLGVDIVFNICEGQGGRNRESQVPVLLDIKGIPYVGADGLTLGITLDKIVAKQIFQAEGVPTAPYFVATNTDDLDRSNTIGYPLIVKTSHEGTSKGITISSRVADREGLRRQVHIVNTQYHQRALVEKFIKGTEFTVAVLGNENPEAMPVVQISMDGDINLGDRFYSSERITASSTLRYVCPAQIPDCLSRLLQEVAVRAYQSVGCRDFGRVDFRVDEDGNPYVLEINPLPSLSEEDVFNIFPNVIGTSYDAVLNKILDFALERCGLLERQGCEASPIGGTSRDHAPECSCTLSSEDIQ